MEMGQIPYIGEGQGGDIDGISRGIASPTLPHPGAFDILLMQIPYCPLLAQYWGVGRDIDRRINANNAGNTVWDPTTLRQAAASTWPLAQVHTTKL